MSFRSLIASLGLAMMLGGGASAAAAKPAPLSPAEIDRVVAGAMQAFSVPGMAVGIVKDGKLVFSRGYGVREVGKPGRVDADTVFAIGSISKSFTTATIAMLVDEGRLHWDDPVIDHLADFRLYDPYVTREFTVRDLLTHRSGLGIGAGDLLFVTPTDFTRADLLHALRFLKPVSSFRSQFAYDNLLYVVAGEVVHAVTGQGWEDYVADKVLAPLGMRGCTSAADRLPNRDNVAAPHLVVEGHLRSIAPLEIPLVGPAGGIQCNVNGMARWLETQLAHGAMPDGQKHLFSAGQGEEMWSPQIPLRPQGKQAELTHTHFQAYGLGWGLEDFNGVKRVSHNGGLPGMVTHVSMIPELNLGVIVLTNQQEGFALASVALPILEGYLGVVRRDWVAIERQMKEARLRKIREADAAQAASVQAGAAASVSTPGASTPGVSTPGASTATNLDAYVGTYEDPWRGAATISRQGDGLQLAFSHTQALTGPLEMRNPGLFVAHWNDRGLDADAYVRFEQDFDGRITGFTMRAVSAATDFSFDFQDLAFKRAPVAPAH